MTVGAAKLNTGVKNISWFSGYTIPPSIATTQKSNCLVAGNPNRPEVLNYNPDAGVVRTFDSFKCFGYEKC